jgi:hypothetical protein
MRNLMGARRIGDDIVRRGESARLDDGVGSGCLLLVQYNALVRGTARGIAEAERNLLLAVLEDGIRSYFADRGASSRTRRLQFLETKRWMEHSGGQGIFAFDNLCEALGVDPDLPDDNRTIGVSL